MGLKHDSLKKLRKMRSKWKVSTPEELEEREKELLRRQQQDNGPTVVGTVRITAGKAKNIPLEIPRKTRPLTDRMKTQIFDTLERDIQGVEVLDLYAGTGSFALEALSRGAKSATLVDASKSAEKIIEKNVRKTGFLSEAAVIRSKTDEYLKKAVAEGSEEYEVIFIDPPYKIFRKRQSYRLAEVIQLAKQLLPGYKDWDTEKLKGVIIVKHPKQFDITTVSIDGMRILETFRYGMNSITLFILNNPNEEQNSAEED